LPWNLFLSGILPLETNIFPVPLACHLWGVGMSFNILDHVDQLTPDGGSHGRHEGTYHCPVCGAENFKVSLKTGKYSTYSCNCAATAAGKKAIREAIAPLIWEKPPRPSGKKTFTYDGLSNGVADPLPK
jgi:hypothetical protein